MSHKRDLYNPQTGYFLRQSSEMPKNIQLEQVLAENLGQLMDSNPDLDTFVKVAKRSGVGKGTVERIRKAEVSTSVENIGKLAEAFGVTIDRLLKPQSNRALKAQDVAINLYDAAGSMGNGLVLRDQPGLIQAWTVSPEWVHKNIRNYTGIHNLCIVTGFGNSMQPLYNPGDPLIVDRGITVVDADATYFFRVGNEGFIKILQRIPGEGIRVISKNKDYETWTIKPDMDFEVFGQVLKVWCGVEV